MVLCSLLFIVWPVRCFVYSSFRPSSWFCVHCCSLSGLQSRETVEGSMHTDEGRKNRGKKGTCDHALWRRGKDALMAGCSARCLPEGVWPYPVMKKGVLVAGCSAKKGRCDHILWQKEKRCFSGRLMSKILARRGGACQGLTAFMCVPGTGVAKERERWGIGRGNTQH